MMMSTILVESATTRTVGDRIRATLASVGLSRDELEKLNDKDELTLDQLRALERVRRFEFLLHE
ncbi:hypothetical protein GCM10009595_00190 [Falsarthrobacter nasiphocae]